MKERNLLLAAAPVFALALANCYGPSEQKIDRAPAGSNTPPASAGGSRPTTTQPPSSHGDAPPPAPAPASMTSGGGGTPIDPGPAATGNGPGNGSNTPPGGGMTGGGMTGGGMTGGGMTGPAGQLVYALKMRIEETVNMPVLGGALTDYDLLGRVELSLKGGGAQLVTQFCDVNATSNSAVQFSFPPAAISAFPVNTVNVTLTNISPGAPVNTPPIVQQVSWQSDAPDTDPLPTDDQDPRVVDGDHDGNPGFTVQLHGLLSGPAYVVARARLQLAGKIESLQKISGSVNGVLEQSIVGSRVFLLPNGELPATAGDPANNPFQMIMMSDPASTCADIKARAATLFP